MKNDRRCRVYANGRGSSSVGLHLVREGVEATIPLPLRDVKSGNLVRDRVDEALVDVCLAFAGLSRGEYRVQRVGSGVFLGEGAAVCPGLVIQEEHRELPEPVLAPGGQRGHLLGNPPGGVRATPGSRLE